MARSERPVDPTAGPVQALAYDLRKLRAEAGNPTYRALARSAGYSASTLSEAAGGMRLPTLEVLLAYVGACGGDPIGWRRRWHEAAAAQQQTGDTGLHPTDDRAEPPADAGPGAADRAEPPVGVADRAEPPVGAGSATGLMSRRWAVLVCVAAATVAVGIVAVTGLSRSGDNPARSPAGAPGCPGAPAEAVFSGVTYGGGAHVRGGATRDEPVLRTIPPHCTVGFTGYCVGEKVYDNTGGTPDVRWFKLAGGGVVSSAVIHGNPPRGLRASDCPHGRPVPSDLALSVVADNSDDSASVTLQATGRDLHVVGFTTSTGAATTPGRRTWRQVALVDVPDPAVGARARLATAATPQAGEPVVVVAAACLGGDSPTGLVRARQVRPAAPGRAVPVTLDPGQQAEAAASACRYPNGG
ncbi:helix-turn-helix transcriptional regulator [Plantactinospora sp. B5E13]|uniref:helix-turn-helix domain-containing protein n=1 Tax=Plantactinospora sp. B5E13 TaxID=3153758 RepID=UPI00325F5673